MTNWRTGFAVSEGERIYWECAGTGVPVVICHGAGSNHVSFYQQMTGLAGEDCQLVLWDQRGSGNSSRSGAFDLHASARDLDAVLAAVGLGDAPVHIIGQAMGGLVAGAWALAHPGRTLTLAFWDGPFGLSADGNALVWALETSASPVAETLGDRQVGRTQSVGQAFQDADYSGTYLYQTVQLLGTNRPSYRESFAAAQAAPLPLDGLRALDAPILFGWGEFDPTVDGTALAELAVRIPGATTVTLAKGGHSPYFEMPEAWNAAVRAHLARTRRGG
jgi:pimeloyl-ACP methyl ester carboxylesterase